VRITPEEDWEERIEGQQAALMPTRLSRPWSDRSAEAEPPPLMGVELSPGQGADGGRLVDQRDDQRDLPRKERERTTAQATAQADERTRSVPPVGLSMDNNNGDDHGDDEPIPYRLTGKARRALREET